MPTAVITESSEKTMSRKAIWAMTAQNAAPPRGGAASGPWATSSLSWISKVALAMRKSPPPRRMRSRPVNPLPNTPKSGRVSPMSQLIAKRSASRVPSAAARPMRRALRCRSRGSRPARMAMKTMLSMPRTISIAESVTSEIQVSGCARSSSIALRAAPA
jgi:hypothetical protein